jgi:Acyl-CoA carboxylase epsilon subunit
VTTPAPGTMTSGYGSQPVITVTKGNPDPAEIAAVAAVLTALSRPAGPGGPPAASRSGWASPARRLREPLARGAGGWRASGLPQ